MLRRLSNDSTFQKTDETRTKASRATSPDPGQEAEQERRKRFESQEQNRRSLSADQPEEIRRESPSLSRNSGSAYQPGTDFVKIVFIFTITSFFTLPRNIFCN